jgi:5-methylcytosine-specific restriction endonuclease McrA
MPRRSATVCGVPSCPHRAVHEGLCAQHRRVRGRPWRKVRRQVLERAQHRCEQCGVGGVPLEVHHVRPLAAGGAELPPVDELLALCADCHRRT